MLKIIEISIMWNVEIINDTFCKIIATYYHSNNIKFNTDLKLEDAKMIVLKSLEFIKQKERTEIETKINVNYYVSDEKYTNLLQEVKNWLSKL